MAKLNIDIINIVLMLASLAVAYYLPFELVLISYAFLGPAHYLTQISWMHDRDYFAGQKWFWIPGLLISLGLIYTGHFLNNHFLSFVLYAIALALSIAFASKLNKTKRAIYGLVICAFLIGLSQLSPGFMLALLVLLPTVIHIYVFTGSFILFGALKSKSLWGMLSFAIYVLCGAAFFFIEPQQNMISPEFAINNIDMFDQVSTYLANLFSFNGYVDGVSMLAFLSFAYTYHYLNWFSKAEIIKWNAIPPKRLAAIIVLYLASISLYLYDYRLGFIGLALLSIMHVILEFPLNAFTFKELGRMVFSAAASPIKKKT